MRTGNLFTHSNSATHPLRAFSEWFDECFGEHQIELAEFVGHFCYPKLFLACSTVGGKIFAFKQYLKANEGILEQEDKVLLFIDDIIEFIGEINETAFGGATAREKVINELNNITSLRSMINEFPQRANKWIITYEKWQRFKMKFSFFRNDAISYF